MLIKYILIGAVIVLFVVAIIMTITNIIQMMSFKSLIIVTLLSIMVGVVMFHIYKNPNEYKFQISYDNVIYYTNDFTVSNGAITFIDENGNKNTIDSTYTLKKIN